MTEGRFPSVLQPLLTPIYRRIWAAALASNIGTWMQTVGAAWLMASLSTSPLLIALVQTASTLPVFLLAVPAGAIADVVDRRKLLLVTQSWMLAAAALLGALTIAGRTGPVTLLLLTFALGLGSTMNAPAWLASVPQLVPREQLPSAVALNSVQFNIARAIGPAAGGVIVSIWNPGAAFILNAISFLGVVLVLWLWEGEAPVQRRPGGVGMAIREGFRYIRKAAEMRTVLVRTGTFVFGASAVWAMLPVVAKHELGGTSRTYGLLLAALGAGSVLGAVFFARLRAMVHPDALVAAGTALFATATAGLGYTPAFPLLCLAMLSGGIAWMCVMATFNVSAQVALPAWVRARGLSFYILVFQGSMAVGGWVWGHTATQVGTPMSLYVAAAVLLSGLLARVYWPLHPIREPQMTAEMHWPEPAITTEAGNPAATLPPFQPPQSRD